MKSPTKRVFYHFGVYTLYLGTTWAPFWLHFDITDTVGRCSTASSGQNFLVYAFCCSKDISKVSRKRNFKKSHSDKTFYHLEYYLKHSRSIILLCMCCFMRAQLSANKTNAQVMEATRLPNLRKRAGSSPRKGGAHGSARVRHTLADPESACI